jgi:signal transduction histidine kinase
METDMRFVASFCDVIVAESKRLETVQSDKAKSDFVSSVSHELRSPLHGILGSAEILAEQGLDDAAVTMVEQINSCGRTLLDVVDHLLDFANLKQQPSKRAVAKSSNIGRVLPRPRRLVAALIWQL